MPWSSRTASLNVLDERVYIDNVVNAGSVFIGPLTPESAGDYASGTNHTLPTNGYARMYSGVNLDAFTKKVTYQKISEEGLKNIGMALLIVALLVFVFHCYRVYKKQNGNSSNNNSGNNNSAATLLDDEEEEPSEGYVKGTRRSKNMN